jgi:AcrR family transcriptional regulator
MPTREEAKELRRARILAAARELIRETERTRFSMRALAERAGVSLVTPYNLFGSKQGIMFALLDEDIDQYAAQLGRSRQDPLKILFRAVTLGTEYFKRDQPYYRAVMFAVTNGGGREFRAAFGGPRQALWERLVEQAIDQGYLIRDTDRRALAGHLGTVYFANIVAWASGQLSLKAMELRTLYGFAMALAAMATEKHTAKLRRQVLVYQGRLAVLGRRNAA